MIKLNKEDWPIIDDYEPLIGGGSGGISNGFVGV